MTSNPFIPSPKGRAFKSPHTEPGDTHTTNRHMFEDDLSDEELIAHLGAELKRSRAWNARLFIFAAACLSAAIYQVMRAAQWNLWMFAVCFAVNIVLFMLAFGGLTSKIRRP